MQIITFIKKTIEQSGFKNMTILTTGSVVAQLISFVSQPIVTRLYSPEDFGRLGILLSLVTIFTPIMTLQYHMSIVVAKSDREAKVVSALSIYLVIIISFILTIGVVIYNYLFPHTFLELGYWIYLIIPLLILTGFVNVLDSFNNRFEQYKLMASISLYRSVLMNSFRILFGIFSLGFLGLAIAQIVSQIAGVKKQAKFFLTNKRDILNSSILELKEALLKFKVQPLYSLPGLFVTTFSFSILTLFINNLYNIEEAGQFYLSMSLMGIPLTLISSNVARIFFRKATIENEIKGNFFETFKSTFLLLIIISTIVFFVLWLTVEPLFSVVFGVEWIRSGTFVKILIPMFTIRFVVTALMHGFIIAGKQLLKLFVQFLFIITAISIYFITLIYNKSIEEFLYMVNIGYFVIYMILLLILFITSKGVNNKEEKNEKG